MIERIEQAWSALRSHPAFRAGAVYAGGGFVLLQVLDVLDIETGVIRAVGGVLALGFLAVVGGAALAHRSGDRRLLDSLPAGRRLAVAVVALFLAGAVVFVVGQRLRGGIVEAGAERIAVLPFSGGGSDSELGEGMVDLLSASLDQVGGVSTVHPRTVMSRWDAQARGGAVDLAGALAVGRAAGAGSVLLGSLVNAGDKVRLTAELYTTDGDRIGEARTEGPASAVLILVDELAVRILREVWRSTQPIPNLRLSAITTSSVDALRHYLRGERHYRSAQWDSAIAAFGEAVALDSTFALARLRLGESHGWVGGLASPAAMENARAAVQLGDRLPTRERRIARAHLLHEQGDLAALDTLERFVRDYPDDPMGWYLLADVRFHALALLGPTEAELLEPVDRVLALDPELGTPISHVLDLQILTGDSAGYDRWLDRYRATGSADTASYAAYRRLRWSPPDSFPDVFEDAFRRVDLGKSFDTSWRQWAATPLMWSDPDPELALRALEGVDLADRPGAEPWQRSFARQVILGAAGRVDEMLAAARATDGPWYVPVIPLVHAAAAGLVSADSALAGTPREPRPFFQAAIALGRGEPVDIQPVPDSLVAMVPPEQLRAIRAIERWSPSAESEATVADERALLDAIGYAPSVGELFAALAVRVARRMAESEETREAGIRRLEALRLARYGPLRGPVLLALARAYEEAGRGERAAASYAELVQLWDGADPALQPAVADARRALERLAGEG